MEEENQRRDFLKTTISLAAVTAISGISLLPGCKSKEETEKEVSPPEDLMQEHGVLNRILLIYDYCKIKLLNKDGRLNPKIARGYLDLLRQERPMPADSDPQKLVDFSMLPGNR